LVNEPLTIRFAKPALSASLSSSLQKHRRPIPGGTPATPAAAEQIREQFLFTLLTDEDLKTSITKATGSATQTKLRWTKYRLLVEPIIAGTMIEPRFFDFDFRKRLYEASTRVSYAATKSILWKTAPLTILFPAVKVAKRFLATANLPTEAVTQAKMRNC